ncbi:TPA: type III secretion apparatus protein OrgA/MxiK, partial [Escherichia albertii]|nr:type III secretion apparatus protein OrgA/MxiK [Escherichia albertii]
YENSPVLLTDKLLHKPKSVNYIDIISFGFSVLLSFMRQQPLAIQQRFNLLFPDFVDSISTIVPVTPLLLKRITDYAKKNRNELIEISIKWGLD